MTWVYIGVAVFIVLVLITIYNSLVSKRVQCQEAWSQIDVQLKRRYDLIPNLIETVKGYAAHEKETLERVITARNQAIATSGIHNKAAAEDMLSGALRQLFALSEAYPNLKANENFSQLQEELASTENKIAFSRQHYNASAGVYNTARQTFPSNLVAGMFGFNAQEYFQVEDAAQREPVKVKF